MFDARQENVPTIILRSAISSSKMLTNCDIRRVPYFSQLRYIGSEATAVRHHGHLIKGLFISDSGLFRVLASRDEKFNDIHTKAGR